MAEEFVFLFSVDKEEATEAGFRIGYSTTKESEKEERERSAFIFYIFKQILENIK